MGATHKLEGLVSICLVKSCLNLLLPRESREIWGSCQLGCRTRTDVGRATGTGCSDSLDVAEHTARFLGRELKLVDLERVCHCEESRVKEAGDGEMGSAVDICARSALSSGRSQPSPALPPSPPPPFQHSTARPSPACLPSLLVHHQRTTTSLRHRLLARCVGRWLEPKPEPQHQLSTRRSTSSRPRRSGTSASTGRLEDWLLVLRVSSRAFKSCVLLSHL